MTDSAMERDTWVMAIDAAIIGYEPDASESGGGGGGGGGGTPTDSRLKTHGFSERHLSVALSPGPRPLCGGIQRARRTSIGNSQGSRSRSRDSQGSRSRSREVAGPKLPSSPQMSVEPNVQHVPALARARTMGVIERRRGGGARVLMERLSRRR